MGLLDFNTVTGKFKRIFLGYGLTAGISLIIGWMLLLAFLDVKCVDDKPVKDVPWNVMGISFAVITITRYLL
jgi:hypothetical protein